MDLTNESPYSSSSPSSTSSPQSQASNSQKRKAGRRKFCKTRHAVYRGVRQRNGNRWVCEVREPNKKSRIWLGTYPTPEMAARAHDVAVLALKGSSAAFNFPDSVSVLPVAKSSSATDIREAASKAAAAMAAFAPTTSKACLVECEEEKINVEDDDETRRSMFFDEEALYNMPGLLDSMAEGLLITPPSMKRGLDWDHVDCEADLTLWTD